MNEWLITNKELISIYSSVFQTIGAITVPIALACWAWYSENKKDERDKKDKEKEYISNYVKEELIYFTVDKYLEKKLISFTIDDVDFGLRIENEDEYKKEIKRIFKIYIVRFTHLQTSMRYLSYSYMETHFNLLYRLSKNFSRQNNLSSEELHNAFVRLSINIHNILVFLIMSENEYQEEVVDTILTFVENRGKIRDITLEVLSEPKYKRYYDSALEEIKKQDKNQYFKINKKAHH